MSSENDGGYTDEFGCGNNYIMFNNVKIILFVSHSSAEMKNKRPFHICTDPSGLRWYPSQQSSRKVSNRFAGR